MAQRTQRGKPRGKPFQRGHDPRRESGGPKIMVQMKDWDEGGPVGHYIDMK
jgi:hypothetical protein